MVAQKACLEAAAAQLREEQEGVGRLQEELGKAREEQEAEVG